MTYLNHKGIPSIAIVCENKDCPNEGTIINRITSIESTEARDLMIEQWSEAHTEDDICDECQEIGCPVKDERCINCFGQNLAFPCKFCEEPLCQDCDDIHTCEKELELKDKQ